MVIKLATHTAPMDAYNTIIIYSCSAYRNSIGHIYVGLVHRNRLYLLLFRSTEIVLTKQYANKMFYNIQYSYTAMVLAIQASVSIVESDAIPCHCDLLNMRAYEASVLSTRK